MRPIALVSLAAVPLALAHNARSPYHHRPARMSFEDTPARRADTTTQDSGDGLLGGLLGGASSTSASASQSSVAGSSSSSVTSASASSTGSASSTISSITSGILSNSSSTIASASSSLNSTTSALLNTSAISSAMSSTSAPNSASTQYTTDAAGQTQVVTEFYTASASVAPSSASSAAASAPATPQSTSSISTPAIVGIAVGVGAVVLALIGLAVWRMKRRGRDEDEAIRWPELNRHGDSSTQHALPARRTGQHGFETNALERSLTNSSDTYPAHDHDGSYSGPVPMALNGSAFGAASLLADEYDEKADPLSSGPLADGAHGTHGAHGSEMYPGEHGAQTGVGGYEYEEDYTSFPPIVQPHGGSPTHGYDNNDTDDEGAGGHVAGDVMSATYGQPVSYNPGNYHHV